MCSGLFKRRRFGRLLELAVLPKPRKCSIFAPRTTSSPDVEMIDIQTSRSYERMLKRRCEISLRDRHGDVESRLVGLIRARPASAPLASASPACRVYPAPACPQRSLAFARPEVYLGGKAINATLGAHGWRGKRTSNIPKTW